MSQEKVNRYKEEKANRKKIMRKERAKAVVRRVSLLIVTVALVGWVGYSAHETHQRNMDREIVEVNFDSIIGYMEEIQGQ